MLNLNYETVREICNVNESFKMKYQFFGETEVAQCTYFLASPDDFFDAKKDGSNIKATELRGITFIRNNGGDWKRFLFLNKFFNINQTNGCDTTFMKLSINGKTEQCNINKIFADADGLTTYRAIDLSKGLTVGSFDRATETVGELFTIETLEKEIIPTNKPENSWMYPDVINKKIIRVANKDDGSAIRFLLINGELMAKTKFSFESEQCELAMAVVNKNKKLKDFILKTLECGLCALFEIVSPFNRIVLSYPTTQLKLLQLRIEDSGEFLDIYDNKLVSDFDVITADQENIMTLDEMIEKSKTIQDKEGWVITFEDGKMAKIKTTFYMNLHGLLSDGLKEHKLVSIILNDEIDDLLSFIPIDHITERDFINELSDVLIEHVNHVTNYCIDTFNSNFTGDRKKFAMNFKTDKYFYFMTKLFQDNSFESLEKYIIKDVIIKCRKLEMAKTYLKQLGFVRQLELLEDD